jgi:2-keto-4-pentenoate hydratase/2-oxohepta-3-ene-1,7-dioic acid hydratase in catechol pathway
MRAEYRVLSYRDAQREPAAGILIEDRVHPASSLITGIDTSSVMGLLEAWDDARAQLGAVIPNIDSSAGVPLSSIELLAPILYPRAIYSVWGNYVDHNAEMAALSGRAQPVVDPAAEPFFVQKTSAHSVIGTGAAIRMPSFTAQLDYEAELGVVIGRRTRDIPAADAQSAVAGYVILNDLSARDMMKRKDARTSHLMDWFGMKSFEDSAPMGPWLTPAEFVRNPAALSIKLWVNGAIKQNGSTSAMVYSIADQVAALSRRLTLLPGDVIATGCPAGVGVARGEFLQPGDKIRIEIEGCGELVNTISSVGTQVP